jgi:hypothetical protein
LGAYLSFQVFETFNLLSFHFLEILQVRDWPYGTVFKAANVGFSGGAGWLLTRLET